MFFFNVTIAEDITSLETFLSDFVCEHNCIWHSYFTVALRNKILIYLTQLQRFNFDIATDAESMSNEMHMQSNNDISRTFLDWQYGPIDCYISHHPDNRARSHMFSLLLSSTFIFCLTYGFQGGLHKNVRYLYLSDILSPFNHAFFLRVARSFSLLTHLTVLNNRFPDEVARWVSSSHHFEDSSPTCCLCWTIHGRYEHIFTKSYWSYHLLQ